MNQDPKDQKPLSDQDLEKASGGGTYSSADVEAGGGGATAGGTDTISPPTPTPPMSLEESGMTPETYYALFPAAKPLNPQ